jgi:hypothetical protein
MSKNKLRTLATVEAQRILATPNNSEHYLNCTKLLLMCSGAGCCHAVAGNTVKSNRFVVELATGTVLPDAINGPGEPP